MNEQIQEYLLKTLDGIDKGIESTVGFLSAEIPLYVQELLLWYGVKSFVVSVFCVIGMVLLTYSILKYSGRGKPDERYANYYYETLTHDGSGSIGPQSFMTGTMYVALMLFLFTGTSLDWLQIWIAPRVWLLEYASTLVK